MANEKQLGILSRGVKIWNQWREKHPNERIDLREAYLRRADLREADLCRADLRRADLREADLREATLRGVHLRGADLRGVDLENAIFQDAQEIPNKWIIQGLDDEGRYSQERLIEAIRNGFKNLSGANLSKANLNRVDLSGADLHGVDLREANLRGAYLKGVGLRGADLENAIFQDTQEIPEWIIQGLDDEGRYSQRRLIEAMRNGFKNLSKATLSSAALGVADLREADLRGAYLREADLHGVDLREADLRGAYLKGVGLWGADLENAIFQDTQEIPEWIIQGLDDEGRYSQKRLIEAMRNGFKNLGNATLSGAHLKGADLSKANLSGAHLKGADLSKANLSKADLSGASLSKADLSKADLRKADLREAYLSGAYLRKANLRGTDLSEVYLSETYLSGADLSGANLRKANLNGANLSGLNLSSVDLSNANLSGADLYGASLYGASLRDADLSKANLSGAYLKHVNLGRANLSQATITGVCLYNTARDDWMINGIICDYVFWDDKPFIAKDEKQWELEHRIPKNRNFRPGEFEDLYRSLPTFEYRFEFGFTPVDIVVMDRVVHTINKQHPEIDLKLKNFEAIGTPHATFTVQRKEHVEVTKTQLATDYEARMAALEGKQEQMMNMFSMLVGNPQLPAGNVSAQLDHIRTGEEAQRLYTILNQKLGELRQAYIFETDPANRFKLKHQITQAEADLKEIEKRLEVLESKEDNTQKE